MFVKEKKSGILFLLYGGFTTAESRCRKERITFPITLAMGRRKRKREERQKKLEVLIEFSPGY